MRKSLNISEREGDPSRAPRARGAAFWCGSGFSRGRLSRGRLSRGRLRRESWGLRDLRFASESDTSNRLSEFLSGPISKS